jgi:hypothetical protein
LAMAASTQFQPPNGGWLGWSQVLACFAMSICSLLVSSVPASHAS